MNLEEFKKYCEKVDDNLVSKWDYDKFKIKCCKCKASVAMLLDDLRYNSGSNCPTCGYEGYHTGKIIVKCPACGNAMQILDSGDFKD